jgi:hypothetical protein
MGGRRPRLGGREWFGWSHVRPAALCAATGGSLTLATVVLGLFNKLSAQQLIALAVLATLATAGWIGLVIPDAWAAWRRGFQQGFKLAMNREAQRTQSTYRGHRTRKSLAVDRPEPVAGDQPESVARGEASGDTEHVIVPLPARRFRSSPGKSSWHR